MATINEMRQVATQIQNETQVGGNTAGRVGGLFNDVVDKLEEDETDIGNVAFDSNEKVADVSIFQRESDLTGKSDAQMSKMIPSGKIINNIEQIIGSATYETKVISNDFSTAGYYEMVNGTPTFSSSANWKCKIVAIEDLANTSAVGVDETAYINGDVVNNIPPIIYLSDSSPSLANYVGSQYGTVLMGSTVPAKLFARVVNLNVPLGATYAIINNQNTYGSDSTITYKSGTSIRDELNALQNEVETDVANIYDIIGSATYDTRLIPLNFTTAGYYKIDGNSLVFVSSDSWKCKVVSIDELAMTDAAGVAEDKVSSSVDAPPIIYLSGASPVWSNFIGRQYGTAPTGSAYFKKLMTLRVPSEATHAIINNNGTYGADSSITYKTGTSIKDNIQRLENRFVVVDKNGNGNFATISDAVNGTSEGDTIIVNAGTYEEDVHMWGKTRHIVGVCRETCILTNGTGNYLTPPLEANIGSISNMTIIADNYAPTIADPTQNQVLPSYGIHVEYANPTPYKLTIRNCRIVSKWCAGMGIGLRYNQTLEIIDSDLISEAIRIYSSFAGHWVEMGGLYFHNDNSNNVSGTGILIVRNCRIQGKKAALIMEAVNKTTMVDAEFECNTFISEDYGVGEGIIYRYDNMVTQEGYLCGNKITLGIASHANNIEELNA